MSNQNDYEQSMNRRARATRFEQVLRCTTATTVKVFTLQPGLYEVAAESAEVYVLDGNQTTYDASQWARIESGDYKIWESRKTGDALSVYLSTGATVRITRRCQG